MAPHDDTTKVHLEYIREAVDGINARLDALNGRTRKIETVSAVHSWAIGLSGVGALAAFGWLLSKF